MYQLVTSMHMYIHTNIRTKTSQNSVRVHLCMRRRIHVRVHSSSMYEEEDTCARAPMYEEEDTCHLKTLCPSTFYYTNSLQCFLLRIYASSLSVSQNCTCVPDVTVAIYIYIYIYIYVYIPPACPCPKSVLVYQT